MATMHVAWINVTHPNFAETAPGFIGQVISSENVTTTSATQSGAAPAGTEAAICTAIDSNTYAQSGANPTASATTGVAIMSGAYHVLPVTPGQKISGLAF